MSWEFSRFYAHKVSFNECHREVDPLAGLLRQGAQQFGSAGRDLSIRLRWLRKLPRQKEFVRGEGRVFAGPQQDRRDLCVALGRAGRALSWLAICWAISSLPPLRRSSDASEAI